MTKTLLDDVERNADKIFQSIKTHGPQLKTHLLKSTHLDEKTLNTAIGWLARENKIWTDNNRYGIGDTNLTGDVGTNAGKIWRSLEAWGEIDITSIARLAEIPERDAYTALGWLACEDKIQAIFDKPASKKLMFFLK